MKNSLLLAKNSLLLALCAGAVFVAGPAFAQNEGPPPSTSTNTNSNSTDSNSTSAGIGIGSSTADVSDSNTNKNNANSQSNSAAGAIAGSESNPNVTTSDTNGQGQHQGQGQSQQSTSASNSQTINNNSVVPATQTLRTAPEVILPALTTNLTETCMGSTSLGLSVVGWGASGGTTWNDSECVRRLNARELISMGFRAEACYVLSVDRDVQAAFQKTGASCIPAPAPPPEAAPPPPPPPPPAVEPPPPPPTTAAPAPGERGFRQIGQDSDL